MQTSGSQLWFLVGFDDYLQSRGKQFVWVKDWFDFFDQSLSFNTHLFFYIYEVKIKPLKKLVKGIDNTLFKLINKRSKWIHAGNHYFKVAIV